jgi:glycosyltransferase involved in cell wall biosynthesis
MAERLRLLYISHYYPPEVNAPAVRVSETSRRWAETGADVTVLTCFPNHPAGIIPNEYRGLWCCRESRDGVDIVRTYVYAAPNRGFFKRTLNFLSFMISSVLIGSWMVKKPDVVVATSPQFFVAVAGYVISRLRRARFVFEVRDIWPAEILAVGAIKNRLVIRALEALEMFLYRKADLIVAVARGTIEILARRGIPESKMALVPNGVDVDAFSMESQDRAVRKKLGIDDEFVVGYIGTHGMAHRLEIVLEAARMMQDRKNVRFLFVGDGAEKAHLVEKARAYGLGNVVFHDQVSHNEIPGFYAACDVCLVTLKKTELFTKNIPSKIYEIMAARKPIIISTEGESRRLVEACGAGLAARPEDTADLVRKIALLESDRGLRERMGRAGYAFVLANSSRARLSDEYLAALSGIVGRFKMERCVNTESPPSEHLYGVAKCEKVSTR